MTDISRQKLLEIGGILIALLLPLAFNPFSSQPSEGIKVTILQAITSLMVIACVISSFIKHSTRSKPAIQDGVSLTVSAWFKDNPLLLPVIIYTGVYIIATIISIDQPQSFWGTSTRQGTLTIMFLVVFFIMIAGALRSSIQVDRLISTLIVVSVPVAIYGWLQYFGLDPLDWDITSLSPVHSTVGYSLYLGAFLSMVVPFTLFKIFGGQTEGPNQPIPFVIILILQVMCLIFTLSRGAWLGLLGGCMVFFWLLASRWQKRLLTLAAVVFVAGGFLLLSMNKGLVVPSFTGENRLSDAIISQNRKVSNNERLTIWANTIPMISSRFLLGYGPETYSTAFWLTHTTESFNEIPNFNPWDPHNIILYHLTAIGVLGLISFMWIIARFYRKTYHAYQGVSDLYTGTMIAAILSSATVFLIQAQFNPYGIVPLVLFWLVLAFGVSANRWITSALPDGKS